MALVFGGATSDRVTVAAASSIDDLTAFSVIQWVYITTDTANRRFWDKDGAKTLALGNSYAGDIFAVVLRATDFAFSNSNANFVSFDEWNCVAMTYDETNGIEFFQGTLNSQIIEEGSYDTQDIGVGATSDDNTGDLRIGNNDTDVEALQGRIGTYQHFNKRLSLGEIQAQQFNPHVTAETVVYQRLGLNGAGTQPDYSGNDNSGTITGATVGDFVPLRRSFFMPMGWLANIERGPSVSDYRFRQRMFA